MAVPGSISYSVEGGITGYWADQKFGIRVSPGDGPFVVTVPLTPAGTIYGRIVRRDGGPIGDAWTSVVIFENAPELKDRFFSIDIPQNNSDGTFMASPLPLGGKYAILSRVGDSWALTKPMKINRANPIVKVEIEHPEGVPVRGRILLPDGKPAINVPVSLNVTIRIDRQRGHGSGGAQIRTNADGRFVFEHVNPDLAGEYEIRMGQVPGYQPIAMKIDPKGGEMTLQLQKGYSVTGVVVDDATGYPVSGVEVNAEALDSDVEKPAWRVEADLPSDMEGKFRFSTMGDREYFLSTSANEIKTVVVRAGQTEPVTIRVKIPKGSRLVPKKPIKQINNR
jgi:hypothetical protein